MIETRPLFQSLGGLPEFVQTLGDKEFVVSNSQLLVSRGYSLTDSMSAEGFYNLGNERLRSGQYRAAMLLFLQAASVLPNEPILATTSALKNAGNVARALGLFQLAAFLYDRAYRITSDDSFQELKEKAAARSKEGTMDYWQDGSDQLF